MAVATHTHPGPWWDEEESMVLTVVQILEEQTAEIEAAKRKG